MAREFQTPIDLSKLEITNVKAQNLSSDPTDLDSGDEGIFWYNTTGHRLKYWNGSSAELKATDSDKLQGNTSAYHLSRTHHTDTQPASTISDLATVVQAYHLSDFAAPTANLSIGSKRLTSVADPTSTQDAATKNYVDQALADIASGQVTKGAVLCVVPANISISSAPSTVDGGVTPEAGDILLLVGQTDASENGPRVFTASGQALNRAENWDSDDEAVLGSYWVVERGTKANNYALLANSSAVTLDATDLEFTYIGADSYTEGDGIDLTGGVITAVADTGVTVGSSGIGVDFSVVGRKYAATVPASSSGKFSISGSVVTINHGFGNAAVDVTVRYGSGGGAKQGALVEVEDVASDTNNVVLTFATAPTSNLYVVSVIG